MTPQFSPDVIAKAEKLLGAKLPDGTPKVLQDLEHPSVWWVTPSSGASRRYRVQSDFQPGSRTLSWITCTCPHGINKGGGTTRCYHAAAVLLLIRDGWAAEDHQAIEEIGGTIGCTCGWPTEADYREHTPKWKPDFSEHLLQMRRKVS